MVKRRELKVVKPVDSNAVDVPSPYLFTRDGIFLICTTREGDVEKPLSNFTAIIERETTLDDGWGGERRSIDLRILGPRGERTLQIRGDELASGAWIDRGGADLIVKPGPLVARHVAAAVQFQSLRNGYECVKRYGHCGWREIDGEWRFLTSSGALGAERLREDVAVELEGDLRLVELPDPATFDARETIAAFAELLADAPSAFRLLVAHVMRGLIGGPCDFTVWLVGATGSFKTELAALAQQFVGHKFNARSLPGSWSSTANALELAASIARDVPFVVDDFLPRENRGKLDAAADRLIRATGNASGRRRLDKAARLLPARYPCCALISTGEDLPSGHSLRGRLVVVELAKGDVEPTWLTRAQRAAANGLLARVAAIFVERLACDLPSRQRAFREATDRLRRQLVGVGGHSRTPDVAAQLLAAWGLFLETVGPSDLWQAGASVIVDVASTQWRHQEAADTASAFVTRLRAALASGRCHVRMSGSDAGSSPGAIPKNPTSWGYTLHDVDWRGNGPVVGYLEEARKNLLLIVEAAISVVQGLGGSEAVTTSETTLLKRLNERRWLSATDEKRGTLKVRRVIDGAKLSVASLALRAFDEATEGRPVVDLVEVPYNPFEV